MHPLKIFWLSALVAALPAQSDYGDFFERDFPWHGSTVEAAVQPKSKSPFPTSNRTPRGLVLRAGPRGYACFDTELLRIAAVWLGDPAAAGGVTEVSMAAGSYPRNREASKAPQGQGTLPRVRGRLLAATGMYPGWQTTPLKLEDPRPRGADRTELGRGPLPLQNGRFARIEIAGARATVIYRVHGVELRESWSAMRDNPRVLVREMHIAAHDQELRHVLADVRRASRIEARTTASTTRYSLGDRGAVISITPAAGVTLEAKTPGVVALRITPSPKPISLRVIYHLESEPAPQPAAPTLHATAPAKPTKRWPQSIATRAATASTSPGYAIDKIPLPTPNPWRRNVRAAGIAFFPEGEGRTGRAAVVTYDGDVWILANVDKALHDLRWSRFATGLHEPQSIVVSNGDLFVFARTGVMRLVDSDGDGEADRYENYCNRFAQSAETREFAMDMELAPDGSLILAKGGQQKGHLTLLGGTILRIPPGGQRFEVIARGTREAFVGVHPTSGAITASDQQGHWVPSTVVRRVARGDRFGFRDPGRLLLGSDRRNRAPDPNRKPWTWIPHAACKSAAGQVWAPTSGFGPLSGHMLQISYFDPGVLAVYGSPSENETLGAAARLPWQLWFAPLDGRVRSADASVWLTGFRIWGSESSDVSGLARVRATGRAMALPTGIEVYTEGVVLKFGQVLGRDAARRAGNYVVQSFAYQRSSRYGSGHFRRDGKPGHDALLVTGVQLGRDRRSVLLRVQDLRPVMQLAVSYSLRDNEGKPVQDEIFATVPKLTPLGTKIAAFDREVFRAEGIAPKGPVARASVAAGAALFRGLGCAACHSLDGTTQGKVGPTMKGLFGRARQLTPKGKRKQPVVVQADADYIRRSILRPAREVVQGYSAVMPSYSGVIRKDQVESLILYLRSLR